MQIQKLDLHHFELINLYPHQNYPDPLQYNTFFCFSFHIVRVNNFYNVSNENLFSFVFLNNLFFYLGSQVWSHWM